MRHINPENVDYFYFTGDDDVSHMTAERNLSPLWPNHFMREEWATTPEVRLVGVPWPQSNKLLMHFLYWGDGVDLGELDTRVVTNTWADADFEQSAQTILSPTTCPSCSTTWQSLVMLSDAYLGAPGLLDKKLKAWMPRVKRCPACDARLRRLVVKIYRAIDG